MRSGRQIPGLAVLLAAVCTDDPSDGGTTPAVDAVDAADDTGAADYTGAAGTLDVSGTPDPDTGPPDDTSPPPPVPDGCCEDAADCPEAQQCLAATAAAAGERFRRCALPCGCDADCEDEHPGVCVSSWGLQAGCAPLKPEWVQERCDAANLVTFDGEKCLRPASAVANADPSAV